MRGKTGHAHRWKKSRGNTRLFAFIELPLLGKPILSYPDMIVFYNDL
jgi:hypothetical protein